MSFRQALYTKLPVWLGYITSGNGYTNTLRTPFKGVKPASANNTNLSCWYILGNDKPIHESEDDTVSVRECSLFVGIFFKSDQKEGGLITQYESLVADMLKWVYKGANAGKSFAPDAEMTGDLADYGGAKDNGIEPQFTFNESYGELVMEIILQYTLEV
jgi:hypothetical protein